MCVSMYYVHPWNDQIILKSSTQNQRFYMFLRRLFSTRIKMETM